MEFKWEMNDGLYTIWTEYYWVSFEFRNKKYKIGVAFAEKDSYIKGIDDFYELQPLKSWDEDCERFESKKEVETYLKEYLLEHDGDIPLNREEGTWKEQGLI